MLCFLIVSRCSVCPACTEGAHLTGTFRELLQAAGFAANPQHPATALFLLSPVPCSLLFILGVFCAPAHIRSDLPPKFYDMGGRFASFGRLGEPVLSHSTACHPTPSHGISSHPRPSYRQPVPCLPSCPPERLCTTQGRGQAPHLVNCGLFSSLCFFLAFLNHNIWALKAKNAS